MVLSVMDIVGYKPYLSVFEESRYKTLFGKIIGTFTIISISILCLYFTIATFLRSEVSLIYNASTAHKTLDLSKSPLMLLLTDGFLNPIPDKYQEIRVNVWNFTRPEGNNFSTIQTYEIPLETCTSESFGEYASLFSGHNYTKARCIPYQKYNLTLFGTYGSVNPNNFINIVVNMCNNQTTNDTCPDQSVIAPVLNNVYLNLLYIDHTIDNYNFQNPIQPYVRSESFPINWQLASRYFYHLNSLTYITDVGSVFESYQEKITYKYNNYVQSVQIRHGSALYPGLTIGTLTISMINQGDQYNRSYPKLQTLLARIGGAIQGILLISEAICYFITKNMFLAEMINLNFINDPNYILDNNTFKANKIEVSNSSNLHLSNVFDGGRINVLRKNNSNLGKSNAVKKEKKEKLFKPGIFNVLCPNFCCSRKNKHACVMISAENILSKKMSYENIFKHLVQYERLKKILLSPEQSTLIDNLPKIHPIELKNVDPLDKNEMTKCLNLIKESRDDKINDKLIKIFS